MLFYIFLTFIGFVLGAVIMSIVATKDVSKRLSRRTYVRHKEFSDMTKDELEERKSKHRSEISERGRDMFEAFRDEELDNQWEHRNGSSYWYPKQENACVNLKDYKRGIIFPIPLGNYPISIRFHIANEYDMDDEAIHRLIIESYGYDPDDNYHVKIDIRQNMFSILNWNNNSVESQIISPK